VGKPAIWCIGIIKDKDETFCSWGNPIPYNLRRFAGTFAGIDIRKN
jgi:hypothetical protein